MHQAKLYLDFDWVGVLDEVTRTFDRPFDVLEEEVHDDGTITFVIETRDHRDAFLDGLAGAPEVPKVEPIDDSTLLVRKEAKGASQVIRENHGKLNGVDRVHGTKRVFDVMLFRREDLPGMIEELQELGDVRLERVVELTETPSVLSDRQHEVVTTALESGYFEWPRETDAEALAERLGVTHATALEHLRKAERKLLERALEEIHNHSTRRDRQFLLETSR
ncbi:MAG: helix-turn-helix domain-containing protein [Halobacteriales archaeon]